MEVVVMKVQRWPWNNLLWVVHVNPIKMQASELVIPIHTLCASTLRLLCAQVSITLLHFYTPMLQPEDYIE